LNLFAPESVITPDGRRVMWGWLFELPGGVQSLPRELILPNDHILRIKPVMEMEKLRSEAKSLQNVELPSGPGRSDPQYHYITNLPGEALEIRAIIDREKAENANTGFKLFADNPEDDGLPVIIQANSGKLRVGDSEAPFAVADLPEGEDLEIRIFIDKYLVEVFVNNRQALPGWSAKWKGKTKLFGYSCLEPSEVKELTIWKLKSANEGFYKALESKIVE
jgi:sucrose-6-phosphate hydrolase SacC (GH32 family)